MSAGESATKRPQAASVLCCKHTSVCTSSDTPCRTLSINAKNNTIYLFYQCSHTLIHSHILYSFVTDLYLKLSCSVWPTQWDRYYHRGMSSSPRGAVLLLSTSLSFPFFLFSSPVFLLLWHPSFSLPLQLFLTQSHLQAKTRKPSPVWN